MKNSLKQLCIKELTYYGLCNDDIKYLNNIIYNFSNDYLKIKMEKNKNINNIYPLNNYNNTYYNVIFGNINIDENQKLHIKLVLTNKTKYKKEYGIIIIKHNIINDLFENSCIELFNYGTMIINNKLNIIEIIKDIYYYGINNNKNKYEKYINNDIIISEFNNLHNYNINNSDNFSKEYKLFENKDIIIKIICNKEHRYEYQHTIKITYINGYEYLLYKNNNKIKLYDMFSLGIIKYYGHYSNYNIEYTPLHKLSNIIDINDFI